MIPIKGYSTFDPLKHIMVGKTFSSDFFRKTIKNKKISDPLQRIADETEEDYQTLTKILTDAGVTVYRPDFDENKFDKDWHGRPPVCPRDHFATIGETFYVTHPTHFYGNLIKQIDRKNLFINNWPYQQCLTSTAFIVRCGRDIFFDVIPQATRTGLSNQSEPTNVNSSSEKADMFDKESTQYKGSVSECKDRIELLKSKWEAEGFRVHMTNRGYHSDGTFCLVKPGCIVSLHDIQEYDKEFPGWDVLYLPDQSWNKVEPFMQMKEKVGGRWWLKGEEHNNQLIDFVNTWLNDWVGYVEETVFDVNMLSIDQNTIICNNYNKKVFDHFKKHKVEPIIFNFRHRYFWDGGVHCITQDFYREGTMEDYLS